MTNEFVSFGDPDRFCIRIGWTGDTGPESERPLPHGWSMGRLEILVGGVSLTAHRVANNQRSDVQWYLGPFLHWLADNWIPLFHEELLPWFRPPAGPAASSAELSLRHWSRGDDPIARQNYDAAQAWYFRHCIASASAGGLFPRVYLRRVMDDVEISWTGQPPEYAPSGFHYEAGSGAARLNIEDVAEPIWKVLKWVSSSPPAMNEETFRNDWDSLCGKINAIPETPMDKFAADIAEGLLKRVQESFRQATRSELLYSNFASAAPYIATKPIAVAMFGGLEPNLTHTDIVALRDLLIERCGHDEGELLARLCDQNHYSSLGMKPYEDGYDIAACFLEDVIEEQLSPDLAGFIDVSEICKQLGIDVRIHEFDSRAIRGVALAGQGFGATIVVNNNSAYNTNEFGQRFSISHELCHILVDRNRARGIGHTSGAWASPSIEKRANAFAAYLLMPRELVLSKFSSVSGGDEERGIRTIAEDLKVSFGALTHHLCNLGSIDEEVRDRLLLADKPKQ